MTRMGKIAAGAGIAVSAFLVAAMAVIMNPGARDDGQGAANLPQAAHAGIAKSFPHPSASEAPPGVAQATVSVPANAAGIPDAYLQQLSAMVDLPNADHLPPDKQQWAKAIPIAQKLLKGPCDCEQRNWLNRFVEMGNFAITDSGQYYGYAGLMAHLGRNDTNAMAISHPAN